MLGCMKRLISATVTLVVLAFVAYAGWRWGGGVFSRAESLVGGETVAENAGPMPTPEIAETTLARIEAFRAGETDDRRLMLEGVELSSVVRYSLPGIVPSGVSDPSVEMDGEDLFLGARVAVKDFPDLPALDEVMGLLPDTVQIEMRARLQPFDSQYAALTVRRVEASRIPLPSRMIPGILRSLGRADREGLASDQMAVPLPYGIAGAWVENGRLVLSSDR